MFVQKWRAFSKGKYHVRAILIIWLYCQTIIERHKTVFQNGLTGTRRQIRSQVQLIRDERVVRDVLNGCDLCRKVEGLWYQSPAMAAFAKFRVN